MWQALEAKSMWAAVCEWVASFEDVEFKPDALVRHQGESHFTENGNRLGKWFARRKRVVVLEGSTTAMPCARGFIDRTVFKLRHHANGSSATHRGVVLLFAFG